MGRSSFSLQSRAVLPVSTTSVSVNRDLAGTHVVQSATTQSVHFAHFAMIKGVNRTRLLRCTPAEFGAYRDFQ